MNLLKCNFVLFALLMAYQTALSQPFLLVKDDKIKSIVPEDAVIENIGDGFQFTEGPVWSPKGYLLFTDIPANRIYKWSPEGPVEVYMEPTGNANGLMFDRNGDLIMCQHSLRQIARDNKAGGFETICDNFAGKRFNSPNDLSIRSDGIIYFTDPPYGLEKGADDPAKELSFLGVFMYKKGEVYLIDSTLSMPNGIILSPNEKYLYVANSNRQTGEKQWVRYKVKKDGNVKDRELFADASKIEERGGPDGMTVDNDGNLYVTGPGGVLVYDPSGTWLGSIKFPEVPANCCFGGPEGRTLFATARTSVYKIKLNVNK